MMNHPFHIVTPSPWPILMALSTTSTMINSILFLFNINNHLMMSTGLTMLCSTLWWRDVIRESYLQGTHTKKVMSGIKMGMIMFIVSEMFLFASLFWMLLHSSLSPSVQIAMMWPPKNIKTFNPMDIPMLNSILLISSGMFLTWSHFSVINNSKSHEWPLKMSIMLGLTFMLIQMYEYKSANFSMSDSIYGSAFFMMTGFHGMHVIIGLMMLTITYSRMKNKQMSMNHHINFEAAAWYWHFVDVVWILLYLLLYF